MNNLCKDPFNCRHISCQIVKLEYEQWKKDIPVYAQLEFDFMKDYA